VRAATRKVCMGQHGSFDRGDLSPVDRPIGRTVAGACFGRGATKKAASPKDVGNAAGSVVSGAAPLLGVLVRVLVVEFGRGLAVGADGLQALQVLGVEDVVHEAVVPGLLRAHPVVAVGVVLDLVDALVGVEGQDLVEPLLQPHDLLGLDLDVGGLSLGPAHRLVDHDPRVGQAGAPAVLPGREQHRAHRGGEPDADRRHGRVHVLHRVVDPEAAVDDAARRVDVQVDFLLRRLALEVEELGDREVRDLVVDRRPDEDDALLQEAAEDVVGPLAARGLLDDHRDEPTHWLSAHPALVDVAGERRQALAEFDEVVGVGHGDSGIDGEYNGSCSGLLPPFGRANSSFRATAHRPPGKKKT